jgi:integrase
MTDEIKVYVISKGRKNLYLCYIDPTTGKQVTKSAETSKQKPALEAAGKWQAELREGRYQKRNRMTWEAFTEYYKLNVLPALAPATQTTYEATLNVFDRTCTPQKLADVTTAKITGFVTQLRESKLAEATIARHLRHLKAMMRWAHREGLLNVLPKFTMPKRAKGSSLMRGRPITGEEFDRMIEATPKVVENAAADSWKFYLNGLWASGLRLTESLTLRWDDAPGAIVVDLSGRRPMLRIPAEAEKGNRDRVLPIVPEFATLLAGVAERDRKGRVFKLLESDGTPLRCGRCAVGKVVTAIGKAANVVVNDKGKSASAHDLRRAFGQRWAGKVMPTVLRELMRHEDIGTTMKFYVGQNAEATADAIWATHVDTSVDTPSAH